jgi:cytochrome c553
MLILLVCVPTIGMAGDYHSGATLVCSDCHVMHASQTAGHGYDDDGTGSFTAISGTNTYLLRNDVNSLCLECHGGTATIPDVYGPNANSGLRQGGALNEDGIVLDATYHNGNGHTLNSTDAAPGGTWSNTDGLSCVDCHNPHGFHPDATGEENYRNLQAAPGNAAANVLVSYATGTNDLVNDDVYQVSDVFGNPATHYGVSNIFFNEPSTSASDYAAFCMGCHEDFHGSPGATNMGGVTSGSGYDQWIRHPTAGTDIGAVGGGHSSTTVWDGSAAKTNWAKVMSAGGNWPDDTYPGTFTDNTPSCMTCHKGHGNQNAFGLIYIGGTGTLTEEGDDGDVASGTQSVKNMCKQCHTQG